MKSPWTKPSDGRTQDAAGDTRVKDAADILTHGTQYPEKETVLKTSDSTAADKDTDEYDFLTDLFDRQKPAAVREKTAEKKTTVSDLFKGKPKKTAAEKQQPKNKTLRLCLILGIILAVLIASFAGFFTVVQEKNGSSNIFDQINLFFNPGTDGDTQNIPDETPAQVPTPVPEQNDRFASIQTNAFTLESVSVADSTKTTVINTQNTVNTKNMLGDTVLIYGPMQNMTGTGKLSVQVDSSAKALQDGEIETVFSVSQNWLFDGSILESADISSQPRDAAVYFILFKKDGNGNAIYADTIAVSRDAAGQIQEHTSGRVYEKGEYILTISLDPSAPLSTQRTGITAALTIPQGDYFYAGKQPSDNIGGICASEMNWETVQQAVTIPSEKWNTADFRITVNPAEVPVYCQNKQYTTIFINEPWRISWKVSGSGTDPYTGAELILNRYDDAGNLIKTYGFGWKGKYSADTEQITPEFQPGEYELGLFLRGCGITLEFQQNKAMPVYNNLTVREE